jgi:hypothetical protein
MPQAKKTLTEEEQWEKDIGDIMEVIKKRQFGSIRVAVRSTGLSKTTLKKHLKGHPSCRKAHEACQALAHIEENELACLIRIATIVGRSPLLQMVCKMAGGIRKQWVKGVNEDGVMLVDYEPFGKKWLPWFMKRHKNLQIEKAEEIEAVLNEVRVNDMEKWFVELECVVWEFDIVLANIYNMNEIGLKIGDFEAQYIIIDTIVKARY